MKYELRQAVIPGLSQLPVQAQCEWLAKMSSAKAPAYLPHTEYRLHCRLSALTPFLLVWLVDSGRKIEYARGRLDEAAIEYEVLLLQLEDWERQRPVFLGFGEDGVGLDAPAQLKTGVVYDWAVDAAPSSSIHKVLLVARSDVENVRGRWRIRQDLPPMLPPYLAFLQRGRSAGTVRYDRP